MIFTLALTSLLFLLREVISQTPPNGYFQVPPASGGNDDYTLNSVYHVGQTIQLQWNTQVSTINLSLYQQSSGGPYTAPDSSFFGNTANQNHYSWLVSLSYPDASFNLTPTALTPGNVFFFNIYDASMPPGGPVFTSHYFNISNSTASSTASMTSTQTSTPISSSISMYTSISTSTYTGSPTALPTGLTTSAKAGIGVGVSVAGLLGIAALAWFLFYRKRSQGSYTRSETVDPLGNLGTQLDSTKVVQATEHSDLASAEK